MPQHDGKPTGREILARAGTTQVTSSHVHELAARPQCAVCGRPVERMTEEEDDWANVVVFTAHCHGQRESIEIPMGDSRLKGITFGAAFTTAPKRLETASG